jgi:hypothetical protein
MSRDVNPFAVVSVFLLGSLIGGAAALLLGTDEEGQTHPRLKNKLKGTKNRLLAGEEWVADLANNAAGEVAKAFTNAREKIKAEVEMLEEKFGEVDKTKYSKAVNEIVDQMKEIGEVTTNQAKVISKYLMDDYQQLAVNPKKTAKKRK